MTFVTVARMLPRRHLIVTKSDDVGFMRTSASLPITASQSQPASQELFTQLGDAALIKLVLEAVHEFDLAMPARITAKNRAFGPEQTATLLAFCYARGIYGSEEIEGRLSSDPGISYICAGLKPDAYQLRRFRRDNALLLLGIFTRLLEMISQPTGVARPAGLPDHRRAAFRRLASSLLHDAIQADSMARDH